VKDMMGYEIDKEKPIKIEFNYHARGFNCPTCSTGVENKTQKCPFCGQQLLDAYGFDKEIKEDF
jgi:rRNA maturation endonuclease Nob1